MEGLRAAGVVSVGRSGQGVTESPTRMAPEAMTDVVSPTDLLTWGGAGGYWRWDEVRPSVDEMYLVVPIQVLEAFRLHYIPWRT